MRLILAFLIVGIGLPGHALGQSKGRTKATKTSAFAPSPIMPTESPMQPAKPGLPDILSRLEQARSLVKAGQIDDAATQYVWVWQQVPKLAPEQIKSRDMSLAREMAVLARSSESAKEKFVELRDSGAEPMTRDDATPDQAREWVVLNSIVGDTKQTLDWFDRQKNRASAAANFRAAEWILLPMLERRGRWADMLLVIGNPSQRLSEGVLAIEKARGIHDKDGATRDAQRQVEEAQEALRLMSGRAYEALLGSNQQLPAERFAGEALQADPSAAMKMALVDAALRAGKAMSSHEAWLADAEREGVDVAALRGRWAEAMKNPTTQRR